MAMDRKRKGSKAARRGTSHVLMQKKKKKDSDYKTSHKPKTVMSKARSY